MLRCRCRLMIEGGLEKLEQDLAAADSDLNLKLRTGSSLDEAARTVYGVLTVLAGLMVVIAAIITHLPIVGGAGFLVTVLGAH